MHAQLDELMPGSAGTLAFSSRHTKSSALVSEGLCLKVLDDSTDEKTRALVDDKCMEWRERGVSCECIRRSNRLGYKAGALKEASSSSSVTDCREQPTIFSRACACCHTAPTNRCQQEGANQPFVSASVLRISQKRR